MKKRFNIHDWQANQIKKRLTEKEGVDGLEPAKDSGSPFPGEPSPPGTKKAGDLIDKLREDYKNMSDEDLDDFSVRMVEHFLDNLSAQVRAKTILTTRGI